MDRCNFSSIKLWFIVRHSNPGLHTQPCALTVMKHYIPTVIVQAQDEAYTKKNEERKQRNKKAKIMSTSMLNTSLIIATQANVAIPRV